MSSAPNMSLSIGLLLVGVAAMVAGFLWARSATFPKLKTEAECTTANACVAASPGAYSGPQEGCCAIWSKNTCRKGKLDKDGTKCVAAGNVGPMILVILGSGLIMGSVVTLLTHAKSSQPDLETPNL